MIPSDMPDSPVISLGMTDLAHGHPGLMLQKRPDRRGVGVVATEAVKLLTLSRRVFLRLKGMTGSDMTTAVDLFVAFKTELIYRYRDKTILLGIMEPVAAATLEILHIGMNRLHALEPLDLF